MKYSWWKKLIVLINGKAKLRMGWYSNGNPVQFYLVHCKKHGYFEDTLHGFDEYVYCPECYWGN